MKNKIMSWKNAILIIIVVVYFLSPIDFLPDPIYVDDFLVAFVSWYFSD